MTTFPGCAASTVRTRTATCWNSWNLLTRYDPASSAGSNAPVAVDRDYVIAGAGLTELERHVSEGVERVGEGDTMVAVRDIPLRYQNRRQLFPGQHLLQVSQHARV